MSTGARSLADKIAVTEFDAQLMRLKECLGLPEDQQIATVLGMTKSALSGRRKRQSFPEGRVVALKATHPDLDVHYVLTGKRWTSNELAFHEALFNGAATAGDSDLQTSAARVSRNHVASLVGALNDPQVRALLDLTLLCSPLDVDLLIQIAGKFAALHTKPKGS